MVKEKLIINGTTIPLENGIGTVLTYSIKDIEQPDKRKASFSKTIKLPGSKVLNDLLNFIFEINSDSSFNPNLKADAIYLIDDVAVFKGIMQLKNVHKMDNEHYEYDVVLLGELANIFTEFGDDYIDDSDMLWNEFTHELNITNIENSWDTSYLLNAVPTAFAYGSGYTYPMINYGWNPESDNWYADKLYPAVFVKEYVDRMFSAAGFEYDSTFFDSAFFKRLIIPASSKEYGRPDVDFTTLISNYSNPFFATSGTASNSSPSNYDVLEFQTVVSDPTPQYNTVTGELTVGAGNSALYQMGAGLVYTVTLNSGAANTANMISTFELDLIMKVNGNIVEQSKAWVRKDGTISTGNYTTSASPSVPDPEYLNGIVNDLSLLPDSSYNNNGATPNKFICWRNHFLFDTDVVTFELKGNFIPDIGETLNFEDTVTGDKYAGSATINLQSNSQVRHYLATVQPTYGEVVYVSSAIPKKVKKRDFFKGLIEMFNLYIEPDADNPKKLKIEPREDFYNANVVDWSDKLDVSKKIKQEMLASKNKSKYIFTYKSDKDYYNDLHNKDWDRVYSNREVDIVNDFNKDTHKTEVIFSATPSVGTDVHDRVIPTIIGVDKDLQAVTTGANIRILYYDGLKSSSTTISLYRPGNPSGTVLNTYTSYPYCGMWDDPFNPTVDLGFGLPKEIYWDDTFQDITAINNNLYNQYHRKELEEMTDKDSKLVTAWFLLNPVDIYNLDFKKQYYFDNAYFRLQEVKYKPNSYDVSECKFLKLKIADTFSSSTGTIYGGFGNAIDGEVIPIIEKSTNGDGSLISFKSANVKGDDNYIAPSAKMVDIVGDSNKVATKSSNIYILGNNNLVGSNLSNVTLINTDGVTVTKSNTTIVNGQYVSGDGAIKEVTAGTTNVNFLYKGYECDCSGGECDMQLPVNGTVQEGQYMEFKKTDATANKVKISTKTVGELIDGEEEVYVVTQNDNIIVRYNGTNYSIV